MSYSNGIGKGMIANIDIRSELYLSGAAKFAVYYTHRPLTDWFKTLYAKCSEQRFNDKKKITHMGRNDFTVESIENLIECFVGDQSEDLRGDKVVDFSGDFVRFS